jgi:pilus assembly protein Flp/PilA
MLSRLVKFQVNAAALRVNVAALRRDRGATAVEYGLMVALIAVVIIGGVTFLGTQVSSLFQSVATKV